MKKLLIITILFPLLLISCGKTEEVKIVMNSPIVVTGSTADSNTGKMEEVSTGVISESGLENNTGISVIDNSKRIATHTVGIFTITSTGVLDSDNNKFFEADPNTFRLGDEGKLEGPDIRTYSDKDYEYFRPVNGDWERIKIQRSSVQKIQDSHYFYDSTKLYYNGLPLNPIIEIDKIDQKNIQYNYIGSELLSHNGKLYYKGKEQNKLGIDIPAIVLYKDAEYFSSNNRIFLINLFDLNEIIGVDITSFRKIDEETYEDKNYVYKKIFGHYGFEIEKQKK